MLPGLRPGIDPNEFVIDPVPMIVGQLGAICTLVVVTTGAVEEKHVGAFPGTHWLFRLSPVYAMYMNAV